MPPNMKFSRPNNIVELLQFAIDVGIVKNDKVVTTSKWHELDKFAKIVIDVAKNESGLEASTWAEDLVGRTAVEDDMLIVEHQTLPAIGGSSVRGSADRRGRPTCFSLLCSHFNVAVGMNAHSVSDLSPGDCRALRDCVTSKVAYTVYSDDDVRNHVTPVVSSSKKSTVEIKIDDSDGSEDCMHGITSAQEFFNPGGRFYYTKFYADSGDTTDKAGTHDTGLEGTGFSASDPPNDPFVAGYRGSGGFGANSGGTRVPSGGTDHTRPPPPESVADYDVGSGSANTSGGVVRAKKRVIGARGSHEKDISALRSYRVTGVTMFNNVDELYLDTISRQFAQEILEDLFDTWEIPKDQSESVTYAEDLVWLFLIARTASNKADYNVAFDVPTKSGSVEADFSKLSNLLASKYGVTRRNFARGVADDLRAYLNRMENQFVKTKSAARIGADPQYGDLSFDGSTGCSGMTTSEQRFTKLLEGRNLYERADVVADGASDALMQGIHGGVRSVVSR